VWAQPILADLEAARAEWTEHPPTDAATVEHVYRALCATWPGLAAEADAGPAPEAHAQG
jgi:hypothetical protein